MDALYDGTSWKENGNNPNFQFCQQHNNTVIEELVEKPEEYICSSARNYCGIKGMIEVELLY